MGKQARVVGLLVVGALMAGACGGGGGGGSDGGGASVSSGGSSGGSSGPAETDAGASTTTGALIVDGEVDVEALDALVTDFRALDADQQLAQAIELSDKVERQLYTVSGLEAALGSPEAVDQSITEAAQWIAEFGNQIVSSVTAAQQQPGGIVGIGYVRTGEPSLGEGVFGGLVTTVLGADAVVVASNDGRTGEGDLGKGVHVKVTDTNVELTSTTTFTDSKGVTNTLSTRNVTTTCPAADGTFEASATIDTSSTINNGATGKRGTFDAGVKGTIDDNATLVGYDMTFRGQLSDFVASRGGFIDISGTIPQSGGATAAVNRTGGTVTAELVDDAAHIAVLTSVAVGQKMVEAAKKGWESGRCVELKTTVSAGPKGLKPSASVGITAAPRSKMDGGPVGGTVTAIMAGGGASVTPSATPLPADAEFTYVAPDEENKTGSVALEARSKRGVGKATIDFDTNATNAYQIVGGLEDFQTDTAVCDIMVPFSLSGGGVTANFTGGLTGTYTATGPFGLAASGNYSIDLPNGPGQPGTMTGGGSDTIQTPIGEVGGSGTEQYVLTPITC